MYISEKSREIYDRLAKGWNTWDVNSVTAHVYLPDMLRINVALMVPHMSGCSGDSLWKNVETFGEHSVDGSYTEVNIRYLGGIYKVESAATDRELIIRVTPVKKRYNCHVAFEVSQVWGSKLTIGYEGESILAKSSNNAFKVETLNDKSQIQWNSSACASLVCCADEVVYLRINSTKNSDEIDKAIEKVKENWLKSTITAEGRLGEGLDALRRSLLWNTIYEPRSGRVITPVSRDWCSSGRINNEIGVNVFGNYVLFGWDTFFAALQLGLIDKDLCYANTFAILEEITPNGFIPNFGCGNGNSGDRSEPQVGSLCVWKLYQQYKDKWFVEECFDRLLEWNRWRFRERDFLGDGLLELGSTPWDVQADEEVWSKYTSGGKLGACLESGIDNSPMWDRAGFDEEKHGMKLYYVGLCAEMVFDCELLEKMAVLLGKQEERKELEARRLNLSSLINERLWDDSVQFYMNKHWSGEFDPCLSLTNFYPITAGIVPEGRLDAVINNHLLNEEEFWGDYVIPNVSRNDPSFSEQDYWRGRIWAPTNFIVGEGIMRAGRKDVWDELIRKGLDLFVKCWRQRGVVGENYNAITGEAAEPHKASDRFYHWGALLVYMAVERVVNFNEWKDKVEIDKIPGWLGSLKNIPIEDRKYDFTR